MRTVLSIAGSDPSGGAGIQADLKTMCAHGVYGMSVITALTAQNTLGVSGVYEFDPLWVKNQLSCVLADIFPDAIKIGMIPSESVMRVVIDVLKQYDAQRIPIVIDPVMVSTSGRRLMSEEAIKLMVKELFPLATLITPNALEAEVLSQSKLETAENMISIGRQLCEDFNVNVLVKGGHIGEDANDLLVTPTDHRWYSARRIENQNTHGTGCTLSSSIASNLALGKPLKQSVENAKDYLSRCICAKLDLGLGRGPLKHDV